MMAATTCAARFQSALHAIAAGMDDWAPDLSATRIRVRVTLGPDAGGGFGLALSLDLEAPGVSRELAADLLDRAHPRWPYATAIHGNVEVTLSFAGEPVMLPAPVGGPRSG